VRFKLSSAARVCQPPLRQSVQASTIFDTSTNFAFFGEVKIPS
jgi:hypothetical protein